MDAPLNLRSVSSANQMLGNSIADVVHFGMFDAYVDCLLKFMARCWQTIATPKIGQIVRFDQIESYKMNSRNLE